MSMKYLRLAFATLVSAIAFSQSKPVMPPAPAVPQITGAAQAAMNAIDPTRIDAHVKFLSSDLLEGRGTGARGGDIAAEYIAAQFQSYGLQPAGDNGTFLQTVPMVALKTQDATTFTLSPKSGAPLNLRRGDDYVAANETLTETTDVDAPIVFVGYGINAPGNSHMLGINRSDAERWHN